MAAELAQHVQVLIPEIVTATNAPLSSRLSALTAEKQRLFLAALEPSGGNVTASAKAAGVTRQNAYQWRETSPEFALEWDNCIEAGTENLEQVAYKRATEVSDTLAIFLLKARRPDKYRENIKLDAEMTLADSDVDRIAQSLMASMLEAAARKRNEVKQLGETNP